MLGAGDAFNAGFLSGWLRGEDYDACVSLRERLWRARRLPARLRAGDADAHRARPLSRQRRAAFRSPTGTSLLTRLHRVTAPRTPRPELFVFAFDHRDPFFELARAPGADERRIPALKRLLVRAVAETGGRARPSKVASACCATTATARTRSTPRPAAAGGSAGRSSSPDPIRSCSSTAVRSARRSSRWPVEHVVKCLVPLHPDDDILNRLENEAQVRALYDAVQASGHELLIEIVPPQALARGAGRVAARGEAPLQPRHLPGVVEAAAAGARARGRRSTR